MNIYFKREKITVITIILKSKFSIQLKLDFFIITSPMIEKKKKITKSKRMNPMICK